MIIKKIKITEIVRPEKNVRIHSAKQISEFVRSIKMFGQIRPIVIDENNVILAGNGLYEALVEAGYTEAECYQYSDLTENQKKKLMIADNKIFSLGIDNIDTLNSFLHDLTDDLDIPGYNEEILHQMVADAEEVTQKLGEYGTLTAEEIVGIRQAGERMEQKISDSLNPKSQDFGSDEAVNGGIGTVRTTDGFNGVADSGAMAEIKQFIVCPKCGEKIWL